MQVLKRWRRRKTHPCLIFDTEPRTSHAFAAYSVILETCSWSSSLCFNEEESERKVRKQPNESPSDERLRLNVHHGCRNVNNSRTNKRPKSAEERAMRMQNIEKTLRTRRPAICHELERTWFLQGTTLLKHRRNLQVTHELTVRGFFW